MASAHEVINRWLEKVAAGLERTEALDRPADGLAAAVSALLRRQWATDLLSGTAIGHPVHPLLVAVPIGSWSAAALFDLVGDERGARRLIGIGVLSAVPAAAAGLSDWSFTAGGERRIGLMHATGNVVALTCYTLSWAARRRGGRAAGQLWSVAGAGALTVAGWLGGHLAYSLGVGVDTTAFQKSLAEWTLVRAEGEVSSGTLTAADAGGVPLVLTRDPTGGVVALADRCTHRGGPLHEGEIVAGCLVCPWHGSRFALDGGVVEGPATRPQPRYEVQERDGELFVRRADEPRTLRTRPVGI